MEESGEVRWREKKVLSALRRVLPWLPSGVGCPRKSEGVS